MFWQTRWGTIYTTWHEESDPLNCPSETCFHAKLVDGGEWVQQCGAAKMFITARNLKKRAAGNHSKWERVRLFACIITIGGVWASWHTNRQVWHHCLRDRVEREYGPTTGDGEFRDGDGERNPGAADAWLAQAPKRAANCA